MVVEETWSDSETSSGEEEKEENQETEKKARVTPR